MKTLRNPRGLDLKPCLNCIPYKISGRICPCFNFSGETLTEHGKIILFNCENRRMHQAPASKIKSKAPRGTLRRRSKRKAN